MTSGARLPFVVTLAALLVGAAAPARGQQQPAADTTTSDPPARDETPEVGTIRQLPSVTTPIPDPGAPPQRVRVLVHRPREVLVVSGWAIVSVSYGASLMLAFFTAGSSVDCEGCDNHASDFVIPVAGPLISWSRTPADRRGSPALWVGWTAAQAVGAAMLTLGILGDAVAEWRPLDGGPKVSVVPALTPNSGALSLAVAW